MVLKEFSMQVPQGKVDVAFYLHFDTGPVTFSEIKIHGDFDTGIPHKVQMKQDHNGQWKLYSDHPEMINGELKVVPEFFDDHLSNKIVSKILEIREDYRPSNSSTY